MLSLGARRCQCRSNDDHGEKISLGQLAGREGELEIVGVRLAIDIHDIDLRREPEPEAGEVDQRTGADTKVARFRGAAMQESARRDTKQLYSYVCQCSCAL